MEIACFKLKPNSLRKLRQWGYVLMDDRRDEAIQSMKKENVTYEAMYALNRTHIIILMTGRNIKKSDMTMPINKDHMRITKECLEKTDTLPIIYKIELIYQLTTVL